MCGKIIFRVFYRNQKRLHVQNKHLHKQPLTLSRNPGLNRGPTHYECVALPTELIRLSINAASEQSPSRIVLTPQQRCHYIGSPQNLQVLFCYVLRPCFTMYVLHFSMICEATVLQNHAILPAAQGGFPLHRKPLSQGLGLF